jgi:hypothetical protein
MRHRFLLLWFALAATAFGQINLTVEPSKKTTKTGESGSNYLRTTDYVDRVTLKLNLTGNANAEVSCYFVARDVRTQAMRYHGFKTQVVKIAGKQSLSVESEPAPYSQSKRQTETSDDKRGTPPFGWAVIVTSGGQQIASKASSPQVLKWVQENPPRKQSHLSP